MSYADGLALCEGILWGLLPFVPFVLYAFCKDLKEVLHEKI